MIDASLDEYGPIEYDDHPPFHYPDYRSTSKRHPIEERIRIAQTLSEVTGPGPVFAELTEEDADLTTNAGTGGEALGARIIITGHVYLEDGTPLPGTMIEIWQADTSGRYAHWRETEFPGPKDPNFIGVGQVVTDETGGYRFTTVKPGPYPWGNHPNAWRPSHIHFSLMGPALGSRLVTQMYFPGDPLFPLDPIFMSVPAHARERLVSGFEHSVSVESWALGYRFDFVLRGPRATPFEGEEV
ncbi:MAG: protocatechuate 3,4-dioxygenase subunit beta [Acidimicrobiia bacterium]